LSDADFKKGMAEVPQWLLCSDDTSAPVKSHTHFLRKTLGAFSGVFQNEFLSEKYAAKVGFLQLVDPRVKLLTLLFFAVFSASISKIPVIIGIGFVAVLYAKLSGLSVTDFLRRVWLYLPMLMLIVSIPAATNLFVKGVPLFYIVKAANFAPHGIYFTTNGIEVALRLALRCGVSLSFGYLIFITTRFSQFEKSLYVLHLPEVFVSVLGMAYRYIFVLTDTAREMVEARFSRTVGKLGSSDGRRFFSHSFAVLFIRSQRLSDEVYDAMCCRCYTGRAVSLADLKFGVQDFIFIASNVIIILILILV
jgi:cobalt ECF transporter T component CbiQ